MDLRIRHSIDSISKASDLAQNHSSGSAKHSCKRQVAYCLIIAIGFICLTACGNKQTRVQKGISSSTLHVGNGQELQGLDPHTITGISEIKVLRALYEGLVGQDEKDLSPTPAVAERWTISEDGKRYTFYLRKEALWNNGDPVQARDFEFAFQRILTPSIAAPNAYLLFVIKNAKRFNSGELSWNGVGVRSVDDLTLEIELGNPTPYFLKLLSHPAWYPLKQDALTQYGNPFKRSSDWTRVGNLVSNGPFTLKSWKTNEYLAVERNPLYWDNSTNQLNQIYFYPTESREAEERSFRGGQLHITEALPVSKVGFYRDEKNPALQIDPYLGTFYLQLNTRKPPLSDPRVRTAMSIVIDRSTIVEDITQGMQIPAWGFTPSGIDNYDPGITEDRDEEVAKQLLAEAGFPQGEGFPELIYLYNTSENNKAVAESLQQMWQRTLGIKVTLINQEWKVFTQSRESGEFDILRSSWIGDYIDPSTFLDVWTSESGNNFTGWTSDHYDSFLYQSRIASSQEDRFGYFKSAEELLIREQPIIPIYFYTSVYLKHPAVKGYHPTLLNYHPWKHVFLEASKY